MATGAPRVQGRAELSARIRYWRARARPPSRAAVSLPTGFLRTGALRTGHADDRSGDSCRNKPVPALLGTIPWQHAELFAHRLPGKLPVLHSGNLDDGDLAFASRSAARRLDSRLHRLDPVVGSSQCAGLYRAGAPLRLF